MNDGRNFFDQPIKNDSKPYDNIRNIATCQGEDCTTGCLLDYPYFKKSLPKFQIIKISPKYKEKQLLWNLTFHAVLLTLTLNCYSAMVSS